MPTAYVYVYLEEGPVPAGILETIGAGREAAARFRYGRRYLQRKDRLALDPVQLPLTDPDDEREYITAEVSLSSMGFVMQLRWLGPSPDGTSRRRTGAL